MSIIRAIRDFISPPKLRNKAGGLAWIKGLDAPDTSSLNGRAVKTVRYTGGYWNIEPPQRFVVTSDSFFEPGVHVRAGETATAVSIGDDHLEPWKDIGDGEADESRAYLPPVPTTTPKTTEPA